MNPLVSVVVPMYNVGNYAKKCIASLISQTFTNIEIILIDDGSSDMTGEICDLFGCQDSRVVVVHQNNKGVVRARTEGITRARGKYLAFVDGDDWVENDFIESLINAIDEVDMVCVDVFRENINGKNNISRNAFDEGRYEGQNFEKLMSMSLYDIEKNMIHSLTPWLYNKLYRTEIVKNFYKSLNRELTYAEDTVFLYTYLKNIKSVRIVHKPLYHYVYRKDSATNCAKITILRDINDSYIELRNIAHAMSDKYNMCFQVDKWLITATCMAIKRQLPLDESVIIQEFVLKRSFSVDDTIVVYGAGTYGTDIYHQLKHEGIENIIWVDQQHENMQKRNLNVQSPDGVDYDQVDWVVIAIENKCICNEICNKLANKKVEPRKIIKDEYLKLF